MSSLIDAVISRMNTTLLCAHEAEVSEKDTEQTVVTSFVALCKVPGEHASP